MSDNTEQERAVVEAVRYATCDDCLMTDREAAVAIEVLARAGLVLVERALVVEAARRIKRDAQFVTMDDSGKHEERGLVLATRLRRAAAPGNGEGT